MTGQLSRSFSPAGALAFGALGASRKTDTRKLFLVVQGAGDGFVVSLPPAAHEAALTFAVKINAAAGS